MGKRKEGQDLRGGMPRFSLEECGQKPWLSPLPLPSLHLVSGRPWGPVQRDTSPARSWALAFPRHSKQAPVHASLRLLCTRFLGLSGLGKFVTQQQAGSLFEDGFLLGMLPFTCVSQENKSPILCKRGCMGLLWCRFGVSEHIWKLIEAVVFIVQF